MTPQETIKKFVKKTLKIDPDLSVYVFRNISRENQYSVEITRDNEGYTGYVMKFLIEKEGKNYYWKLISRNYPSPNFEEFKVIYNICYDVFKRGIIEKKLSS
jgi:hypothetical protein